MADSLLTATWTGLLALSVNGVLLLGSFWIARYGLLQPRQLAAALATAVVFWTACTLGLETLGALGAISIGPMLACGSDVSSVSAGSFAGSEPRRVDICSLREQRQSFRGTL